MENDSQSMKSEAISPAVPEDSEELKFLKRLLLVADEDVSMGALMQIRDMLYKRIQEVEMRDWNI